MCSQCRDGVVSVPLLPRLLKYTSTQFEVAPGTVEGKTNSEMEYGIPHLCDVPEMENLAFHYHYLKKKKDFYLGYKVQAPTEEHSQIWQA